MEIEGVPNWLNRMAVFAKRTHQFLRPKESVLAPLEVAILEAMAAQQGADFAVRLTGQLGEVTIVDRGIELTEDDNLSVTYLSRIVNGLTTLKTELPFANDKEHDACNLRFFIDNRSFTAKLVACQGRIVTLVVAPAIELPKYFTIRQIQSD